MQGAKINKNRTFLYVKDCVLCGNTDEYEALVRRLKKHHKDVQVKQISLFIGWQREATEIGLPVPFVYDFDTGNAMTLEEANNLEDIEELIGHSE